jgi:chromosome segregation ATPase
LEIVTGERDELREQLNDVATTARELEAEVEAYRAGDRGEGEKQLVEANQRIAKLEGEIRRLEAIRDDWMNKHAEALKQIKRLQRQLERGHA